MIDSTRLRTLAAFAEDTNLSRTARRLHLSQPAVHAQLKALAEEVGAPLYRRDGRQLVLTPQGAEVAAFARDQAERCTELQAKLRGEAHSLPIVLATGAGALVHLLGPGLRTFTRSGARLRVVTAGAAQSLELVRKGLAHVGVAVLPDLPTDLEHHLLVQSKQVAVVPRTHALARRRSLRLVHLRGQQVIVPPEGGPQHAALQAAFAQHGVHVDVVATTRGWEAVLSLVELGVGIGFVNDTCVVGKRVRAYPLPELPPVAYRIFTRPGGHAASAALVTALRAGRLRAP